jgi:hypothetical protein
MRRRVLRQASCLPQNAGYVPGCLRRRTNDSEGGLSEKSQAEHQRCTELHRDLLSGCNIHRCARLGVRPSPPAERDGHLMRPRGRGKEMGTPASNFRPPVNGDSRLDEGGQWRQPVDPTPDTDARLRRRHGPNVFRRGRCPERRERVNYRPRPSLYHGHPDRRRRPALRVPVADGQQHRGPEMLKRARLRSPNFPVVRAAGAALPFLTGSVSLLCFGQSWHWVEQEAGASEAVTGAYFGWVVVSLVEPPVGRRRGLV